jgi:hypothetical protein
VKPWTPRGRSTVALLAIAAILFAPAAEDGFPGLSQSEPAPIEARLLAPTVREGMVAAKLSTSHLEDGDQSQPRPFGFALLASAVAVLVIGAVFAGSDLSRRTSAGLSFSGIRAPRAPPGLRAT